MCSMNETLKGRRQMKSLLAILLTISLVCAGSICTYAGVGNDSYECFGVSDTVEELSLDPEQQEEQEERLRAEIRIVEAPSGSVMRSGRTNISWSIAANVRMRSSAFDKSKGDTVEINVDINPTNLSVKAGIVNDDGVFTYVTGKGNIEHTFSIKESGTYRVAVQNDNSKTITVRGNYK